MVAGFKVENAHNVFFNHLCIMSIVFLDQMGYLIVTTSWLALYNIDLLFLIIKRCLSNKGQLFSGCLYT